MQTPNLTKLFKGAQQALTKHSPEILTGIGIAGMVTTTVLAVKATPKALRLIEDEKCRQNRELIQEAEESGAEMCRQVGHLKPMDMIKTTWKCYVPAAITGVASIACLIGANSVSAQRMAALTAAYKISETALTEYREKVVETIGEKKEQVVRDAVAKDKLEKNPVSRNEVIITETGSTLCYDAYSGRYFKSDRDKILKAINEINSSMLEDGYVSLNSFYYEINLPETKIGDNVGWRYDKDRFVKPCFSSQLDDTGKPCMVVDFMVAPHYHFDEY